MIANTISTLFQRVIAVLVFFTFAWCPCLTPAWGETPEPREAAKAPFQIEAQDAQGNRIAGTGGSPASSKSASAILVLDREYQPGDRIVFHGSQRLALRVDENILECIVYLADSQNSLTYEIPYGRTEQQTGSAYAPESFAGKSHRLTVRALNKKELKGYRNLALNPCDLRQPESSAPFFPHATTNSASRGAFDFEARNAIDGVTQNGHHGLWPFQSWGPQLRNDLWWKLDFGRPVELDKVRLMVRADFPHDSYWKSADIEFSDGGHVSVKMAASAAFQDFAFSKRLVTWMRLTKLVAEDPTRWCSFIEVEAWGKDRP